MNNPWNKVELENSMPNFDDSLDISNYADLWKIVEGFSHNTTKHSDFASFLHNDNAQNTHGSNNVQPTVPSIRKIQSEICTYAFRNGVLDQTPLAEFMSKLLPKTVSLPSDLIKGQLICLLIDFSGIQATIHASRELPYMRGASLLVGEWTKEAARWLLEDLGAPGLIKAAAGNVGAYVLVKEGEEESFNVTKLENRLYVRLAEITQKLMQTPSYKEYDPLELTQIGPRAIIGIGGLDNSEEGDLKQMLDDAKGSANERKLSPDWREQKNSFSLQNKILSSIGKGRADKQIIIKGKQFSLPRDFEELSLNSNRKHESLVYLVGDGNNGGARFISAISEVKDPNLSPFYGRFLSMSFSWAIDCAIRETYDSLSDNKNLIKRMGESKNIRLDPLYNDGDDVVYILPISLALPFIEKLHDALSKNLVGKGTLDKPDISYCFGGSVFWYSEPVVMAQLQAEGMEKIAKGKWRDKLGPDTRDSSGLLRGRLGSFALGALKFQAEEEITIDFAEEESKKLFEKLSLWLQYIADGGEGIRNTVNHLLNLKSNNPGHHHHFVMNTKHPGELKELLDAENDSDLIEKLIDIGENEFLLIALKILAKAKGA